MKKRIVSFLLTFVLAFSIMTPSLSAVSTLDVYFDTVQDMTSALLEANTTVKTRGFYEPDDGGGATYNIVSSGVADNYFSFKTINGTIAQLQVENDTVNIRQVGAKGDGITDDTEAINAATLSTYGTIYAPAGTYIVTPETHLNDNTRRVAIVLGNRTHDGKNLIGEQRELTIFKVSDNAVFDSEGNIDRYDSVISGFRPFMKNVTLKNFTIDQNVQNNPVMSIEGIQEDGSNQKLYCIKSTFNNVNIENISFKHHGSNAIFAANTDQQSKNYEIHDCYFEFDMNREATNVNYDNSCLLCIGDGFKIYNNVITTNLDFETEILDMRDESAPYISQLYGVGGIEIHGSNSEVYNNRIDKYYVGIHYRTVEGYSTNAEIYDNIITNTCIGLAFGNDSSSPMEVSGAMCRNNTIRISFAYKKGFRDSVLHPCGFRSSNSVSQASTLSFNDIYFIDNTIEYDLSTLIDGYDYNFGVNAGILLRSMDTQNIHVNGNTFKNAPGWGIEINEDCTGVNAKSYDIAGNQFIDCGWSDDHDVPIESIAGRRAAIKINLPREEGSLEDIIIKDNVIQDTSDNGQCLYSINVPSTLIETGKVVLENNTETSFSGKGFYIPYFSSVNNQAYERIPKNLTCSSLPTTGTFYKDQQITITDGQNIESTWFVKNSGTIGKTISEDSNSGTIESSRYIRMDRSDHGIQSGDIINVQTLDGQTQENVWVCCVTDRILYTRDLDLTGDVTVSYYKAAFKQIHTDKDIETVFSVVPEKTSVVVNEEFCVTITTHIDVTDIKILREDGSKVGLIERSSAVSGDKKIWTVKMKIGNTGTNNVFKVYGALDDLDYSNIYNEFTIENITQGTAPSNEKTVISAVPEKTEVNVNEKFTVVITTLKNVNRIKILNENSANVGTSDQSYVVSGDYKIWTVKIKIGSSGSNRTFKVYGALQLFDYSSVYEEFTIENISYATAPSDVKTVISAVPEKTSVTVNELFSVTVVTPTDVNNIKILNEKDSPIGISERSFTISGDNKIWTLKIKIGSVGSNRTFKVYGASSLLGYPDSYEQFTIENISYATAPSDVKTVISAVPEKTSVTVNELFSITVVTPTDVNNIKILNEKDSPIGISERSFTISGNNKIWTLKIKIGSVGSNRTFKVYGASSTLGYPDSYEQFTIENISYATAPSDVKTVISVVPEKTSVTVNELFSVTVVTPTDVNNIKILNEKDSPIGISERSFTISGDNKIWTLKIKIGSVGSNRTFKVYGASSTLGYPDSYEQFTIENISYATAPSDVKTVISVVPENTSVTVNELFSVTVVTPADVNNIKILNEKDSPIGISERSFTISGDNKIWTLKIKIGSTGYNRTFKVYGASSTLGYPDSYEQFTITIM